MCKRLRVRAVLLTLTLAALGGCAGESEESQADRAAAAGSSDFVQWARNHAIPLPAPDVDAGQLADISPIVAGARVVALGEPAHGARQPLAFRNQLLRYLVEHQGFTAIAIESGFTESRRVFQYVNGGPGDARDVVRENLSWGFGGYEQNLELVQWLRAYNAGNGRERGVRFYGIDLPGGSNGTFPNARIALEELLAYFRRIDSPLADELYAEVSPSLDHFTHDKYASLPEELQQRLRRAITAVLELLQVDRDAARTAGCDSDRDWARRNALTAMGLENLFRQWPPGAGGTQPAPELAEAMETRDRIMAEQVRWVTECEGEDGRILIYAHNAHVMTDPLQGGVWNRFGRPVTLMGVHLRAALGKELRVLGISSASNDPSLPQADNTTQVESTLSELGMPRFLLDLEQARAAGHLSPWIDSVQTMRANFIMEMEVVPGRAFDGLVFFDRVDPAPRLQTNSE